MRKIRVTGGEPLVRKGVIDFLGRLARLPRRPEILLTTNGLELAGRLDARRPDGRAAERARDDETDSMAAIGG